MAAALVIATASFHATAQEVAPESLAASRELMALTKSDQALDQVFTMMTPQVGQMLEQINPDKGPLIRKMLEELLLPEMRKSVPEAIDDIAAIYARNFTAAELADVIAFYKTPTGQKFIDRQPALLTELNQAGQAFGQRAAINALRTIAPKLKEQGIDVPI
ncbi:DUF2059 domain-containing protein [Dongia deserti]|uniref:DUF2059 domain-containing protein n=1 Tax=Dongia deserti TaxID=2268030 RepID=UPI0013C4E302|nr:DUF2059 domain-containing protein [Dongia deserti]